MDEVADGKISRVALAVIAVFLAGLERFDVRRGNGFGAIAEAFEGAVDKLFMFPGQAAEERVVVWALLRCGERLLLRPFEMMDLAFLDAGFGFQTRTFFGEPLLDYVLDGGADLDEIGGRHHFRFKRLSAHVFPSGPVYTRTLRLWFEVSLTFNRLKENTDSLNGDFPSGTGGFRG